MTTFAAWTRLGRESERAGRVHRCYEVLGADAVIRADCVEEIIARVAPAAVLRLDATELSSEQVWAEVEAVSSGGSRLVIVSGADRIEWMDPLRGWLADRARVADTTLVLLSERPDRGRRRRDDRTGRWVAELASWQRWIDGHSAAIAIECPAPSVEVLGSVRATGPSVAAVWLSRRVPVSQRQAAYLWRRVGGSTALARDVCEQLRLLGLTDARPLGDRGFAARVDVLVSAQGAESLVEDLLFDRRAAVVRTLVERDVERAEWSQVLGLLGQRLEWLAPLHHALRSRETLSTVSNNLGIHEKWILHYAHREDPSHNIARHYSPRRVASCRRLLCDLDAALLASRGVPVGFGEVLVAAW